MLLAVAGLGKTIRVLWQGEEKLRGDANGAIQIALGAGQFGMGLGRSK